ncbi:hypothetical protein FD733_18225 [Pantoea sp. Eser]|nr:hypothetical protein [Pantoea sp. Eser]
MNAALFLPGFNPDRTIYSLCACRSGWIILKSTEDNSEHAVINYTLIQLKMDLKTVPDSSYSLIQNGIKITQSWVNSDYSYSVPNITKKEQYALHLFHDQ